MLDASHWAGVATPVLIQQLRFRADGAAGTWAGTTIGALQVDLSHAVADHTQASADPQENLGEDVVRAFDGPASIDPGTNPAGGGTGPFYVTLSLTSPFVYYPAWGRDLVIDLTSSGTASNGGYRLDAETGSSLGFSRVHAGQVRPTAVATEFSYSPHSGAFAAFDVSAMSGPGPLAVQFTDRSWTDDPGGITAWAWDFDGDGTVDSTSPNPSFTYTGCGTFSPSLTVTDAGSSVTRVRTDLIDLDAVVADFDVDVRASTASPQVVQFTDLSAGAPTQWSWDFDGDGQPDSTLQNPVALFPTGVYDVTLTASNACSTDTVTIVGAVVVGPQVRTPFAGNNGIDPPGGVFFDVDVTASSGLQVSALDLHCRDDAGLAFQVEVYLTSTTHVGKDGDHHGQKPLVGVGAGEGDDGSDRAPADVNALQGRLHQAAVDHFLGERGEDRGDHDDEEDQVLRGLDPELAPNVQRRLGQAKSHQRGDPDRHRRDCSTRCPRPTVVDSAQAQRGPRLTARDPTQQRHDHEHPHGHRDDHRGELETEPNLLSSEDTRAPPGTEAAQELEQQPYGQVKPEQVEQEPQDGAARSRITIGLGGAQHRDTEPVPRAATFLIPISNGLRVDQAVGSATRPMNNSAPESRSRIANTKGWSALKTTGIGSMAAEVMPATTAVAAAASVPSSLTSTKHL